MRRDSLLPYLLFYIHFFAGSNWSFTRSTSFTQVKLFRYPYLLLYCHPSLNLKYSSFLLSFSFLESCRPVHPSWLQGTEITLSSPLIATLAAGHPRSCHEISHFLKMFTLFRRQLATNTNLPHSINEQNLAFLLFCNKSSQTFNMQ